LDALASYRVNDVDGLIIHKISLKLKSQSIKRV